MKVAVILGVFLIISEFNLCLTWCLKSLGVQECDFNLLHISVYNFRAFLSVQSRDVRQIPTLVETSWPEKLLSFVARGFPSNSAHSPANKCQRIIQSYRTGVDCHGRLWMVDSGSWECPPKIIVYNLKSPWNNEIHRHVFENATEGIFTSLSIDPVDHAGRFTRAYLTVRGRLLYLYDQSQNSLHLTDIRGIREMEFQENDIIHMETDIIGNLMGKGHSLIADSKNFLYYIIPKDGVVVKWNIKKPLTAENHEILHFQSQEMIGLLFSFQESLWVINAHAIGDNHSHRIHSD
ncbi:uncharacterized protein LOC129800231 [Phlebotomus papatasi]|uniref:uncharacterized protein LOC129800231 n=1 Tax=Phlebotomus papatasi TaxID=29031 RepID=UPI0024834AD1|nr:uncharacterized protein LOC129800231 [Phlebotomus papatasi]